MNDAAQLPAPGTLATVEITGAQDYDLIARAVEFAAPPLPHQSPIPAADRHRAIAARPPNNLFPHSRQHASPGLLCGMLFE